MAPLIQTGQGGLFIYLTDSPDQENDLRQRHEDEKGCRHKDTTVEMTGLFKFAMKKEGEGTSHSASWTVGSGYALPGAEDGDMVVKRWRNQSECEYCSDRPVTNGHAPYTFRTHKTARVFSFRQRCGAGGRCAGGHFTAPTARRPSAARRT